MSELFSSQRFASVRRETKETGIELDLDLDGGAIEIDSSVKFLDHMLDAFARHSGCGLRVVGRSDGMDNHHIIEDVGIALGTAIHRSLGEKRGITRFGSIAVPLDESLVMASVDISGRPYLNFKVEFKQEQIADFPTEMIGEFFRAVTDNAKITLHLIALEGKISHHLCEATFKAFARALAAAKSRTASSEVPSTKGVLE